MEKDYGDRRVKLNDKISEKMKKKFNYKTTQRM
jgi:hypothetical protein